MSDEQWRKRVEEHIVRSEETMLSQAEREMDLKVFIRDQNTRMERVTDRLLSGFEARMEDMGDQIRANTQAVLTVLDRLVGRL